jgi:hypothetical protein
MENIIKASDLKKGSIIAYSNGVDFKVAIITKSTEKFIWFKGSGYDRIAKQTFINHPELYKIIEL